MRTRKNKSIQAFLRHFFLQRLIPEDSHVEPELSLVMDRAMVDFEGAK